MNKTLKPQIEILRKNYGEVSGKTFNYFWCPILFRDEDTELCKGHIVNEGFPSSNKFKRAWIPQRKDVDNFYGTIFESDFVKLKYMEMLGNIDVIVDKEMFEQLNPKLILDGKDIDYFIAKGEIPPNVSLVRFEGKKKSINIAVKMPPSDFKETLDRTWEVEVQKDVRIQAMVSLIKAAHLTLFEMFGYGYALSSSGHFVGYDILGKFFLQNRLEKNKKIVIENAIKFFSEYIHMVRPVLATDVSIEGTINDKSLWMCRKYDGTPWAWIVFVKTSNSLHSVLIPLGHNADAMYSFYNFLHSQQEAIEFSFCRLNEGKLEMNPEQFPLNWIKQGIFLT